MFSRFPTSYGGAAVRKSATAIFPAPVRGWIKNQSLAASKPGGAEVLENFFPTSEGCRMRKGSVLHATIGTDPVTHLTTYGVGVNAKMFATDAANIFDITDPAAADTAPTALVTDLTSGDWSSIEFTNSGGQYLIMVNGHDALHIYDGTNFGTPGDGTFTAITGVTTSDLSHVWKFKSRLFFIEDGTMSAWYLGNLSIGGAATELPLGGVFQEGGSLLFGATWSSDTGSGPDDFCLFVTTEGEIAVYQGSDPSSATTWSLVGVYRIGRPLGKNCWFKAGGDIAIVTDDGIVPLSAAIKTDRAGLFAIAITYPLVEAWRQIIKERGGTTNPFSVVLWQKETMLVVGIPTFSGLPKECLVANTKTGKWAKYTGWDIRCQTIFEDELYFGTASGTILQGETQGADEGAPYSAVYLSSFDTLGSPMEKAALHARVIARTNLAFSPKMFANADYEVSVPSAQSADADIADNTWGSGTWGTTTWGSSSETKQHLSEWQGVAANGQALSAGVIFTSGRTSAPDIELIAIHLQYEAGDVL